MRLGVYDGWALSSRRNCQQKARMAKGYASNAIPERLGQSTGQADHNQAIDDASAGVKQLENCDVSL
jgi:hypothetical protein